jgi:hypothetical protein
VQRFGLFSYWKSSEMGRPRQQQVQQVLSDLELKRADGDILLIRQRQSP